MVERGRPLHVSIVATSEAQVTPLCGLFEVLNSFQLLASLEPDLPTKPFEVEIVGPRDAPTRGASGLPIVVDRSVSEVDRTDIAIVPLMMFAGADWETGRYPDIVDWLQRMYGAGATLCSTCTGVLLLAETGLLDGHEATTGIRKVRRRMSASCRRPITEMPWFVTFSDGLRLILLSQIPLRRWHAVLACRYAVWSGGS